MKRRAPAKKKIELNMTSMIDVIFLLLIFFVMTFKIVIPEGDFSIKMPPAGSSSEISDLSEPIRVRLAATGSGELASINYLGRSLGRSFNELRRQVLLNIQQLGGPDQADVEVELAPDDHLRYEYVIEAITAVTGEVRGNQIYKICDKVKFAPRRGGGG